MMINPECSPSQHASVALTGTAAVHVTCSVAVWSVLLGTSAATRLVTLCAWPRIMAANTSGRWQMETWRTQG